MANANSQGPFFGLFPEVHLTKQSSEKLQKYVNKEHTLQLPDGTELNIDGITLIQFMVMNIFQPDYVAVFPTLPVITYTIRSEEMQKALSLPPVDALYYGIFNSNTLNSKLSGQKTESLSYIDSKLKELETRLAAQSSGPNENNMAIRINSAIRQLEVLKSMKEIKFLTRRALMQSILSLESKEDIDAMWENLSSAISNPSIKVITIPLVKLMYYEGLSKEDTKLVHHANYIVIRKDAKLWHLIEPQRNISKESKFDILDKKQEYKIITEIDKRISAAAGEEYVFDPIRVTCPQAITQDKNCIWWSLFLAFMITRNTEGIDFNLFLKVILRKYKDKLPSLIESFKVYVLHAIADNIEKKGFILKDFNSLLSSLQTQVGNYIERERDIEYNLGGGGSRSKLKRTRRKRRSTRKNGK